MPKTILIVEDNNTFLEILKSRISKMFNVSIITASNYKAAVKCILQTPKIHLAILDLNLPDAPNGEIIDFAIAKHISSIVLTGHEDDALKQRTLEKDIVDYIYKNHYGINQLLNSIKRSLKNYDTHVLLVEDSKFQQDITTSMLHKMNLNVTVADDGIQAYNILNANQDKFSLVITDYNMPNMNGMELVNKIREQYQKDRLSILVLSASDKPKISEEFIKVGANDFINKPFSEIEFKIRVNANLEIIDLFEQTRDLANKDFLTGAYNRRFFFESGNAIFAQAQRSNSNLAVAMIDIDKFKNINDKFGHDIGDIAIQHVNGILASNLRSSDLISRFGGEEFCVLLRDITLDDTDKLFEKIRVSFDANKLQVGDLNIPCTVSIGIFYGLDESLEKMIKNADIGLYFCKANGRNQIKIIN